MTKDLIYQLRDFEIFCEKMEEFVTKVKNDKDTIHPIEEYDIRTPQGIAYNLPTKLEDYFDLWNEVLKEYNNNDFCMEMFFDLYWNDMQENEAFYCGNTFWVEYVGKYVYKF